MGELRKLRRLKETPEYEMLQVFPGVTVGANSSAEAARFDELATAVERRIERVDARMRLFAEKV